MKPFLWLTLAAVLYSATAVAQQSVLDAPGLRAYVAEVLGKNAGYQAAETQLRATSQRVAPAGALPDPMLGAGAMSVPAPSFDLAAADMTQVPLVSLRQVFPFPGKQGAETAVARAESMVAAGTLASVEAALALAGARGFYQLALARTALEVWRSRLSLAEPAIAVAQVRYETGAGPQTDLLRARLHRAELLEEGRQLDAALVAAGARANALRAGATDSITTPGTDAQRALAAVIIADASAPGFAVLTRQFEERNPELRTALAEAERAERMARVSGIAARPDFMVELQTGVRRAGREPFLSAMLGVSIPLWAARKQSPAARAARLDAGAAAERYDDLKVQLEAELQRGRADLEALRDRIALTTSEIIPLAEAASASALQRYQVGTLEFTAVLDSQDDLFRARLNLTRLIADYAIARARLAALVGEEWYK